LRLIDYYLWELAVWYLSDVRYRYLRLRIHPLHAKRER
jgi:hypothetical protein